jgi:LysM repeat protein
MLCGLMDEKASPRPLIRTFAVAVGALVILGACSSGGGSGSSTTTVPTTAFSTIPIQTTTTAPPLPGQGGGAGAGTTVAGGAAAGGATYTVVQNDYFVGIANKLGVPLQALLDANGMTATSLITPGMKLKVPQTASSSTTAAAGGGSSSTTAAGGSGSSTTAGSTSSTAATTTTVPGAGGTYTVQPNDYWNGIAQKLGVDVDDLTAFNDMTINTTIHPGDKLKVPPKK